MRPPRGAPLWGMERRGDARIYTQRVGVREFAGDLTRNRTLGLFGLTGVRALGAAPLPERPASQVGGAIGRDRPIMTKLNARTGLRWRLAGEIWRLPDLCGRDRLMKLLTDDQPVPPGIQAGRFGPGLDYRVRYEDEDSVLSLFFLQ